MLLHLPLLLLLLCTLLEPLARLIGRRWRRGRRRGRYALEICQAFARRCRYWAIVAVRATNVAPDHETERKSRGRLEDHKNPPPPGHPQPTHPQKDFFMQARLTKRMGRAPRAARASCRSGRCPLHRSRRHSSIQETGSCFTPRADKRVVIAPSAWSKCVKATFARHGDVALCPKGARASFITFLRGGDHDDETVKAAAIAMRHSSKIQASATYDKGGSDPP